MIHTKISLKNCVEFIFFLCLNFSLALKASQLHITLQSIATVLNIIAMVFLCIKYLFVHKYSKTALVSVFFIIILGVIYSAYYRNMGILNIAMAILIAKNMEFSRLMRYNFCTMLMAAGFIFFTSILGVTSIYSQDVFKLEEWRSLYAFGFVSSNTPSIFILTILTAYNLLRGKDLKLKEIFAEVWLTVGTYFLFYNRTAGITFILYLAGLLICKYVQKFKSLTRFLYPLQYSYFLFAGLTYYAVFHFDTSIVMSEINMLLSDRLHLLSTLLYYAGIHLLGNGHVIDSLGVSIDNAYVFILIAYGICMVVLYGFIFTYVIMNAYKNRDWNLFMVVIAYLIYGLGENPVFSSTYCNVLLTFGFLFLNSNRKEFKKVTHLEANYYHC